MSPMSTVMPTKNPSKRNSWKKTQKFMEKILDVANQSVHDAFKKFQDTENKNMRRQRNKK
jgi:hypothetical protein